MLRSAVPWLVSAVAAAALVLSLWPPAPYRPAPSGPQLRDMTGRSVPVRTPVRRAAVFVGVDAFITADGGASHLAAISQSVRTELSSRLFSEIAPGLDTLPRLFTSRPDSAIPSDPEQLLALDPDAVVAWPGQARPLENVGMSVIHTAPLAARQPVFAMWRLFGQMTNHSARVEQWIARYRDQCATLQADVARIPQNRRPRVLIMSMNQSLGVYLVAPRTFVVNKNIAMLGATNVAARFVSGLIGLEGLIDLDPDVVFIMDEGKNSDPPSAYFASPWLQTLPAVRARRVYALPHLSAWGQLIEHPLALRWMAELLYPNAMRPAFRALFREQYQYTYGYTVTDAQIDGVIRVHENRFSAGYDRFASTGHVRPALPFSP